VVRIWDVQTRKEALPVTLKHAQTVYWGELSPQGTHALTQSGLGADAEIRLWTLANGRGHLLEEKGPVLTFGFSPDGKFAVTARLSGLEGEARFWDVKDGKPAGDPVLGRLGIFRLCFCAEKPRLVVATFDSTFGEPRPAVRVWDVQTRKPITPALPIDGLVNCVAFSRDGFLVAAGAQSGEVKIWESESGKVVGRFAHGGPVRQVAFSRDSRRLASASDDSTTRVWDAATGKPLSPVLRHPAKVQQVEFSPDGLLVATGCDGGVARVWDAATGFAVTPALRHDQPSFFSFAFSPDGTRLIAHSGDDGQQPPFAPRVVVQAEACAWDLSPLAGPTKDVVARAEWLAGRRLDEAGGVVPLAWAEAVGHLDVLIRDDPEDRHLIFRRGRAHAARGDAKKAIADYTRTIALEQEHWDVWSRRGEAHASVKDWPEAVKDLSCAIEMGADHQALKDRGLAYLELRMHDEAIADFDRLVQARADSWPAWSLRATAYSEKGERPKARADYVKAIELGAPAFVRAKHAFCLLALKDRSGYASACAAMLQRGGQRPDRPTAIWTVWASVAAPEGRADSDRVLSLARDLALDRPRSRTYLLAWGAALYRAKKYDAAVEKLLAARALYTGEAAARADDGSGLLDQTEYDLFFLAMAHARRGEAEKARRCLAEAGEAFEKANANRSLEVGWQRRMLYGLLLSEAKGVVEGKK
jgi:WD40 repeat protein/tetratricopeptide (TPR) repeat protein